MGKVFVRDGNNYETDEASLQSGLRCTDVSKAVQSEKEESDINTIVKRFGITGKIPDNVRVPQYGDFVGLTTYHAAMNAVANANSAFAELPAEIRARFKNNPEEYVSFCLDDKNYDEAVELGIVKKKPVQGGTTTKEETVAPVAVQAAATKMEPTKSA